MAQQLQVGTSTVKLRSPWGIFFLALLTLGIYYVIWYYKINRELSDYGFGNSPVTSVIAITFGALIIVPPFVSTWNTLGRIRQAEDKAQSETRISQGLGFIFYLIALILLPFELPYMQEHLNNVWKRAATVQAGP